MWLLDTNILPSRDKIPKFCEIHTVTKVAADTLKGFGPINRIPYVTYLVSGTTLGLSEQLLFLILLLIFLVFLKGKKDVLDVNFAIFV